MVDVWTFLLILTVILAKHIAQSDYCIDICEACVEDTVSCKKPGFKEMPQQMSKTITKFILLNQIFTNNFLSKDNFTALCPPNVELKHLTIRKSNINLLKSEAFVYLNTLKFLDLSFNYDLCVESRSFFGLNLNLLKLDHNKNLTLDIESFKGLTVQTLQMSYSTISVIPYSLLEPILPSLTQLFLDNNLIKTIDPKYQISFKNLNALNLETNPIVCSCSMKWLTEVYQSRLRNGKLSESTFFDPMKKYPTCSEPQYLKGTFLHEIALNMFLCDFPTLTQLKINFQSLTQMELSCSATQSVDVTSISVEWFSVILRGIGETLSSILSPITGQNLNEKVRTQSVIVTKTNSTDSFKCVAKNVNGNTTAVVRINWPPRGNAKETDVFQNHNNGNKKTNYLFQKRFTLLEMLGAVLGTFAITLFIFVLLYKLFFINRQMNRKTLHPQNGYTTYEATVYSDSQTYDVPGNSYPQSVLLPMPHLSSNPDHFLDFKTQKKLYQTT